MTSVVSEASQKIERIEALLAAWRTLDLDGKRHQLVCRRGARRRGADEPADSRAGRART